MKNRLIIVGSGFSGSILARKSTEEMNYFYILWEDKTV